MLDPEVAVVGHPDVAVGRDVELPSTVGELQVALTHRAEGPDGQTGADREPFDVAAVGVDEPQGVVRLVERDPAEVAPEVAGERADAHPLLT